MSLVRVAHYLKVPTLALAVCSLLACSDTTLATRSFEESRTFEIPGAPISIPLTFEDIPLPVNLADQPGYSDSDFDFVTSVQVRELEFEITPESNDPANDQFEDGNLDSFEFVSNLNISLREIGSETSVAIANLPMNDPQIASNTTMLSMNVLDNDIQDIIEAPNGAELLISISGTPPPDFVTIQANVRFRVGLGFR